MLLLEVPGPP
ncbi:hypothetical protein LINGRAHAP2_LOCUS22746 [Linum grandiflorum]